MSLCDDIQPKFLVEAKEKFEVRINFKSDTAGIYSTIVTIQSSVGDIHVDLVAEAAIYSVATANLPSVIDFGVIPIFGCMEIDFELVIFKLKLGK